MRVRTPSLRIYVSTNVLHLSTVLEYNRSSWSSSAGDGGRSLPDWRCAGPQPQGTHTGEGGGTHSPSGEGGGGGGGGGGHALCGSHLHFPDLPQSASTWRSTLHPCPTRSARLRSCGRCHITSLLPPCVTAPSPPCSPQNSKGSVEVAAKCFYRRKDLPPNLLVAADRHASQSLT